MRISISSASRIHPKAAAFGPQKQAREWHKLQPHAQLFCRFFMHAQQQQHRPPCYYSTSSPPIILPICAVTAGSQEVTRLEFWQPCLCTCAHMLTLAAVGRETSFHPSRPLFTLLLFITHQLLFLQKVPRTFLALFAPAGSWSPSRPGPSNAVEGAPLPTPYCLFLDQDTVFSRN